MPGKPHKASIPEKAFTVKDGKSQTADKPRLFPKSGFCFCGFDSGVLKRQAKHEFICECAQAALKPSDRRLGWPQGV